MIIVKILIATDGSVEALEAARFYSTIHGLAPLDVTVINAIGLPQGALADSNPQAYSQFVSDSLKHEEHDYHAVANLFASSQASLRHEVRYGHIGNCIVSAAEELESDLIVMGSKGLGRNHRTTLGSVSEYVAMHAVGSVLVVRPQSETPDHARKFRITIPFDGSDAAQEVLRQLKSLPWAHHCIVSILAVVPIHTLHPMDSPSVVKSGAPHELQAAINFAEIAAKELRSVGIEASPKVLEAELVGEAIANFAKQHSSDLIMLGARGQGGIARSLLGSVSHYILRHATQSVWVVRGDDKSQTSPA